MAKSPREPTLDLHGMSVAEVPDAVDRFILKHSQSARVRIMSGKGSGAVQKAVIEYLRLGKFPWEHEQLPNGTRNTGVLVVFLA
ncbi:MAG: Smr/MutS family protein [Bdellovibrionaceae bacterium]|nr:Smr/MutS family protein [Pseudobdellovibrionaceae bacterium]